jgi:hypothetical protein
VKNLALPEIEPGPSNPKYFEKTCPSATLCTTNPTCSDLGSNPGCRVGKPATNSLTYVTSELLSFGLGPSAGILETRKPLQKLDLFPSSGCGGETPTLFGLLGRANQHYWMGPKKVSGFFSPLPQDGKQIQFPKSRIF